MNPLNILWSTPSLFKSVYSIRYTLACTPIEDSACTLCKITAHSQIFTACVDPAGGPGVRKPLENHKAIGSLSNTGPNPLKNRKNSK